MPRPRSLGRADKGPAFGGSRGFGASSAAAKKPAEEGPGLAQQRFGNAKSISSSAFHGEASYSYDRWRSCVKRGDVAAPLRQLCDRNQAALPGSQHLCCQAALQQQRCNSGHAWPARCWPAGLPCLMVRLPVVFFI